MQPTNPQTDIIPTGRCEIWVREVSHVIPKATIRAEDHIPDHANPISIENKVMLPQFTSKTRACIYSQDGKCVGMLSPELFQNLNRAFHSARDSGHHSQFSPPPKDVASELVGLLVHRQRCISQTNKTLSQKVKDSYQRVLPIHIQKHCKNGQWSLRKNQHQPYPTIILTNAFGATDKGMQSLGQTTDP